MRNIESFLNSLEKYRADKGQYYDYSKVVLLSGQKICIICPVHGEFLQNAGDHRSGSGCRKCAKIKREETCIAKYGVSNVAKSDKIKQTTKETFIKNYGVDNPSKSADIKLLKEQTCIKNYGVSSPLKSTKILQAVSETNITKYGVSHPMKNKLISKKMVDTKVSTGGFAKSNSSVEATEFIRKYILDHNYDISQCAYNDSALSLHEWGIYKDGKWVLYDLVVFEKGNRGNKCKIIEILEYHGPFHYTDSDVEINGDKLAYPWKTNVATIKESREKDVLKEQYAKELTTNYTIIWSTKWHKT